MRGFPIQAFGVPWGGVSPAEASPTRVLESATAAGAAVERPEEAQFARAVESHLQGDVFALLRRFEAVCSER